MRFRALLVLLALVLLVGACSDDGGGGGGDDEASGPTSAPAATTGSDPVVTTGTVAGPTEGQVACLRLAERYVARARSVFAHEGTPSDALVNRVYDRLTQFDAIAGTAGCGDEYRNGVCNGLDALTAEGILVILPLLPPNGCSG